MRKSLSALIIATSVAVACIATSGTAEAQWGYGWHGGGWGWRGGGWGWRGGLGWPAGWGRGGAALGYTLASPYYGYGYAYAPYSYSYGYYAVAPLYSYDPYYCGDCVDY